MSSSVLQQFRDAFKGFRGVRDSVEKEVDALIAQRDTLQRERYIVFNAPRTKEDVIEDIDAVLDIHRKEYARRLGQALLGPNHDSRWARSDFRLQAAATEISIPSLLPFQLAPGREINGVLTLTPASNVDINSLCLTGMFAHVIKPVAREMIQAMEWPSGSISKREREAKLAELDKKIKSVSDQLTALLKEVEDAGMHF